jgi:putative membrane protein
MMLRLALLSTWAFTSLSAAACGKDPNADTGLLRTVETPAPSAEQLKQYQAAAQTFIDAAGQFSHAEIETSKLAVEHAKTADTKAFAQTLIDDYTKATEALTAAAQTAGLAAPSATLDEFHIRRVNELTVDKAQGNRNFDADFAAMQVNANRDGVGLLQDYIRDGKIPALKVFAEQTLPKLKEHQEHAEMLDKVVRAGTPSPSTPG